MATDDPDDQAALAHLRGLGRILDSAVTIPGTGIRVGLDPLIGLIPGVGDWAGAFFSAYIVVRSVALGVSAATGLRMLGNLGVDLLAGTVPVLGDIFDLGFRANQRNLALLEAHVREPARRRRTDLAVVVAIGLGALALVVGALTLTIWIAARLAGALFG
jgi:hypothetical protein